QSQAQRDADVREIRLVIGHLQAFAERVQSGLEQADQSARRDIIQALVKRIEVAGEEVRIIYRVNCRPFAQAPDRGPAQDCWRRG
ncbi:MAG: recombinase family protein, partial [Phycisphaerae bacterium]